MASADERMAVVCASMRSPFLAFFFLSSSYYIFSYFTFKHQKRHAHSLLAQTAHKAKTTNEDDGDIDSVSMQHLN